MSKSESALMPDDDIELFVGYRPDSARFDSVSVEPGEATAMILDRIPSGSRLLNVGCGTGVLASLVQRTCNATVLGVEPDPVRAEMARSKGVEVVCGYFDESLASEVGQFDVIILVDVIEHLQTPARLIRLLLKSLKPGGFIVLSVPNVAHWSMRLSLLTGRFNYSATGLCDATHLRWFTRLSLLQFLDRMGLDVTEGGCTIGRGLSAYRRRPFSWIPNNLKVKMLRRLSQLWPEGFGCQFIVEIRPRQC